MLYYCFTAALLLLYYTPVNAPNAPDYCFTAALLLLYYTPVNPPNAPEAMPGISGAPEPVVTK